MADIKPIPGVGDYRNANGPIPPEHWDNDFPPMLERGDPLIERAKEIAKQLGIDLPDKAKD